MRRKICFSQELVNIIEHKEADICSPCKILSSSNSLIKWLQITVGIVLRIKYLYEALDDFMYSVCK